MSSGVEGIVVSDHDVSSSVRDSVGASPAEKVFFTLSENETVENIIRQSVHTTASSIGGNTTIASFGGK